MESGLMAEFETGDDLLVALQKLQRRGYVKLDAFTPHPIHGLDQVLGLRRSRLNWFVFPLSLGGCGFAFFIQWWCNAWDYGLNVGGRPQAAWPAFVLIGFETTVLASAIGALLLLFYLIRLPRLSHPVFDVKGFERATIDRFFAAVDLLDPQFDSQKTRQDLMETGALRVTPFGAAASYGGAV
jgi:hypothetical protein